MRHLIFLAATLCLMVIAQVSVAQTTDPATLKQNKKAVKKEVQTNQDVYNKKKEAATDVDYTAPKKAEKDVKYINKEADKAVTKGVNAEEKAQQKVEKTEKKVEKKVEKSVEKTERKKYKYNSAALKKNKPKQKPTNDDLTPAKDPTKKDQDGNR